MRRRALLPLLAAVCVSGARLPRWVEVAGVALPLLLPATLRRGGLLRGAHAPRCVRTVRLRLAATLVLVESRRPAAVGGVGPRLSGLQSPTTY